MDYLITLITDMLDHGLICGILYVDLNKFLVIKVEDASTSCGSSVVKTQALPREQAGLTYSPRISSAYQFH